MEVKGWIPVNPSSESQMLFHETVSGNMPGHSQAEQHSKTCNGSAHPVSVDESCKAEG